MKFYIDPMLTPNISNRMKPPQFFRKYRSFTVICGILLLQMSFQCGGVELKPQTREQLIERFGNPLSFILVGNRQILQYEKIEYWLDGDNVLEARKRNSEPGQKKQLTELIVLDSSSVSSHESIGYTPIEDTFIRGGKYRKLPHELVNEKKLSLSGVDSHISPDLEPAQMRDVQEKIRKVYLRFKVDQIPSQYSNSELILHTSNSWNFAESGYQYSPTMHVFAVTKNADIELENGRRTATWVENKLNWKDAQGNSVTNGADLLQAKLLCSESFPMSKTYTSGIPENQELRFPLRDFTDCIQDDGSVTFVVTHSSKFRLDVYSKDGTAYEWFRPRLLMK